MTRPTTGESCPGITRNTTGGRAGPAPTARCSVWRGPTTRPGAPPRPGSAGAGGGAGSGAPPPRPAPLAGQHAARLLAVGPRRHRVLQVRVPDVAAELADGVFRLLLARHERMMRVPQQGDGGGCRLLEQREQRGRVGEIAV